MNVDPLIEGLTHEERVRNGIPDPETARRRERAAAVAGTALSDVLHTNGVRVSPLGAAWSSDVDVHVLADPEPERLEALGWLPMDGFLARLGHPGTGRWAIVDNGSVLAMADIHRTPPPDPVAAVLDRCRRRGEVRIREALELAALARSGHVMPSRDTALSVAAGVEAALGGSDLARWRPRRSRRAPARLAGAGVRRLGAHVVRRGGRAIGVALNGVDGSGKSTLAANLARDLERLGLPVTVVWTRPGMRIAWLDPLARAAKRLLREEAQPGVLRVAADPDRELRSRRGALGWVWVMLVTRSFVRDVRRRSRRARGVIIYDRHLLDASVTLSFAYRGVDLRAHRRVVNARMPDAAIAFYLDVAEDVAVARKPGDAVGAAAVRRQLESYREELGAMPEIVTLDASHPPEELTREALVAILTGARARRVTA